MPVILTFFNTRDHNKKGLKDNYGCLTDLHSHISVSNCQPWLSAIPATYLLCSTAIQRDVRAARGHGIIPPKFLAYPVILCFEKQRAKQKYCCSPEVKHFGHPQNFGLATPLLMFLQF